MQLASSIFEAGYGGMLRVERDLWDEALTHEDFERIYVVRRRVDDPDPRRSSIPTSKVIAKRLLGDARAKILLTGQKGSGKSTELRKTLSDPALGKRFQVITLVASNRLDLFQAIDARAFLLAIATALAEWIAGQPMSGPLGWGNRAGARTEAWVKLLADYAAPLPPEGLRDGEQEWKLGVTGLVELTTRLRSDEQVREEVRKGERYGVPRLSALVNELLGLTRWIAERDVLLVLDDGDKILHESSARDIFVTNATALLRLPCALVATFPYWLHFDPELNAVRQQCHVEVLTNVKVVTRDAPTTVLPGAFGFFSQLYRRLVAPGADWLSDDGLEEAVRMSGGIPREFLRVLERAFCLADDWSEARVTAETTRHAARELRREMIPSTETEATRRRLERVRITRQLATVDDRLLLAGLLIVELTNDVPWYDVHPLLQGYVDGLLVDRARLLRIRDDVDVAQRNLLLVEALDR